VLSIEQIAALHRILKEPTRRIVFLAVFTGLRVGELLGLKWKDIDFQKMEIHVIRSIVMQHVGDCKTEASCRHAAGVNPKEIPTDAADHVQTLSPLRRYCPLVQMSFPPRTMATCEAGSPAVACYCADARSVPFIYPSSVW
jgi:integrase